MKTITVRRSDPMGWYWKCLCNHRGTTLDMTREGWKRALCDGLQHQRTNCGLLGFL